LIHNSASKIHFPNQERNYEGHFMFSGVAKRQALNKPTAALKGYHD